MKAKRAQHTPYPEASPVPVRARSLVVIVGPPNAPATSFFFENSVSPPLARILRPETIQSRTRSIRL